MNALFIVIECIAQDGWPRCTYEVRSHTEEAGSQTRARERVRTGDVPAALRMTGGAWNDWSRSAIHARHLVLGTRAYGDTELEGALSLASVGATDGVEPLDVTLRAPSAWTATTTRSSPDTLCVRVEAPGTRFFHGGPFAGVGPRFDRAELRVRAGWEIAAPRAWLVHSIAFESNLDARHAIVPAIEATTPSALFVVPSFGFGVGAPLELRSGSPAHVGVRAQLSISFPVVTLFFPFDLYPSQSGPDRFQAAFIGQASF